MGKYELWYTDSAGNRLAYIDDIVSLDMTSVLGDVGEFNIVIPSRNQLYDNGTRDRKIAVYRQPIGGTLEFEFFATVRDSTLKTSEQGQYQRSIVGFDQNELLARRIVAYYADSAEALKTDLADDMMKEIITENFVTNADYSGTPSPTRTLAGAFSVQADTSLGTSITKGMSWRNVLDALQDIQSDTKERGDETFFGVITVSETALQFQTWQSRNDRTTTTGTNPIVFSLEWGNLFSPSLTTVSSSEINYAYAAGRGEKSSRIIETAENLTGINASNINRREGLAWSSAETTTQALTDANDLLTRNRPFENFAGSIIDTPLTPYGGAGWRLGDKVTVNYAGRQFDVTIRAVNIRVAPNGDETISARVET